MEKPMIPIIMDCDPGHDDAIAMVLAHAAPQLRVLGVTTAAGNQAVEKTTYNAQRICTLLGMHVPVAKGRARPLTAEPVHAANIHGQSGLDGPQLPEPAFPPEACSAVKLMARLLRESEEPVTIVATGPLTNVASLLLAEPELKEKIAQISIMGGGIAHGNWSPAAEFNILVDPEAADIVFRSGIPVLMAGLDVTLKALIYEQDFDRIRAIGNPVAHVVADWLEFFYRFHREIGYAGAPLHDPIAVAALIRPELFDIREMYVEIELEGDYCRGATVGDTEGIAGHAPNARAIMGLDREGFVDLLCEAVRTYGGKS